jgi:hypothetical protein
MKKALILVVFVTQISFAQSIFPTDGGNVGIGTISPTQKLDVRGNAIFNGSIVSSMSDINRGGHIQLQNPSKISNGVASTWMIYNMNGNFGNGLQFWAYDNLGCAGGGMCANRFTIMDNGNVGIGTTNPISKLSILGSLTLDGGLTNNYLRPLISAGTLVNGEVRGYSSSSDLADDGFIRVSAGGGANSTSKSFIDLSGYSTIPDMDRNIVFGTVGVERMRIDLNGNIGIGTANPTQKLDINGNGIFNGAITSSIASDTGGHIQLVNSSKNGNGIASTWMIYNMTGGYGNSLQFWAYDNLSCGGGMCNNRFTIMDNGNVGIGLSNPLNKLDVNGTIHSKEVKVDMTGWSDFVFKKEYNLPTLEQVEKHIIEKGHLENIPSEKEVLENGINLGEMNAKLLQKIEELTLYMIEMKKENMEMKNENIEMKKEIKKIMKKIDKK